MGFDVNQQLLLARDLESCLEIFFLEKARKGFLEMIGGWGGIIQLKGGKGLLDQYILDAQQRLQC